MPEALQAMVASDWLDDLGEFPAPMVGEACQIWRRTERRKPTPADIRSICIDLRSDAEERSRPRLPKPSEDVERAMREGWNRRYAEAAEAREKWAREHGCKDFAEAMKIGLQAVARRRIAKA